MIFNSFQFLIFFAVVTTLYFILDHRWRWSLLLISSCYFYMAFVPIYILILAFTIVVDYLAGIYIESASGRTRKLYLVCSLIANIGILAVFKYYNFITFNLSLLFAKFDATNPLPYLSILLPIGLSFHTFQAMSYTIEVYRGKQKAERHFGIYSLYVMFYPQLVAGPIERPQNLLHQFREKHEFNYSDVTGGLKLMAWGFFKKVVIADRLAELVDGVYGSPESHGTFGLALATVFFAYQIYCDFSGYSDIAIGAARVMGYRLMKNFDAPYQSLTISEFWRRWHISLSLWFRDYLYIPLGGNRVRVPRLYLNLFIVFLISGLWHGANWTFIIWGALHGLYLIFALATEKWRARINASLGLGRLPAIQVIITFLLVCFAWIFFRADSLETAWMIIRRMVSLQPQLVPFNLAPRQLLIDAFLIVFLEAVQYLQAHARLLDRFNNSPLVIRWSGYILLIFAILILGIFYHQTTFIYFQF